MKIEIIYIILFTLNTNCFGKSDGSFGNKLSINRTTTYPGLKYDLYFAVLLPSDSPIGGKDLAPLGLASIDLAFRRLQKSSSIFEKISIHIEYRNTMCSSTHGPLAAFDIVQKRIPDVIFGPICDYVLAPIARYSSIWEIPILTTGGLANAFKLKHISYPTLTRMMGSYENVAKAVSSILSTFNWNFISMLFHNFKESKGMGHSDCYHKMSAVFNELENRESIQRSFDQEETTYNDYKNILMDIKQKSRIVILCGNSTTIRDIMLAADDVGMIDTGDYVFLNIELSPSSLTKKPWHKIDNDSTNQRAKKAFSALLTITVKYSDDQTYHKLSEDVKNYPSGPAKFNHIDLVSPFALTFYDSVLLYGQALNDTVNEFGLKVLEHPLNGTDMARRMWNRTIHGLTGDITINANGDRELDYSLLDMDPDSGNFEVVANYYHDNRLEYVEGKKIYWGDDRLSPPLDKPVCGFDNSLCPSLHTYAVLSVVLGVLLFLLIVNSIVQCRRRHYNFFKFHEFQPLDLSISINK